MSLMLDLKSSLLSTGYFIDNEYLEKYCTLVERYKRQPIIRGVTNKHHIKPKALFKLLKLSVDDSLLNLVNLPYRTHLLAHYYLCLCTSDPLKYANQLALMCLISRKKLKTSDRLLITNLPLYKDIYEDYKVKKHNNFVLYEDDVDDNKRNS